MAFELITIADVSKSYPTVDQISVHFMFFNGSAADNGGLKPYPLFGQKQTTLPWSTFVSEMGKIAIGDQATWCAACGNTTGVCAPATSAAPAASPTSNHDGFELQLGHLDPRRRRYWCHGHAGRHLGHRGVDPLDRWLEGRQQEAHGCWADWE